MEYFSVCAIVVMACLIIWTFYEYIKFRKIVANTYNKVKLGGNKEKHDLLWCVLSFGWICLSVSNYRIALSDKDNSRAEVQFLLIIVWSASFILFLFHLLFVRNVYLSANGLIICGALKGVYKNSDCPYKLSKDDNRNDVLEIYYKKREIPFKFKIIEEKEKLISLLEENFEEYFTDKNIIDNEGGAP